VASDNNYEYRLITTKLQKAGWQVGKAGAETIWRRDGLKMPPKQKPRGWLWLARLISSSHF